MYSPKLRPLVAISDINKPRQSPNESTSCISLRQCLLIWAFLRLAVSMIWTSMISISFVMTFRYYLYIYSTYRRDDSYRMVFETVAILAQLVEFGMIVTFITAGFKKSTKLYRAYYRYCILTLLVFVISVSLCFILGYEKGHYFAEIYLTYHITDFVPIMGVYISYDGLIFAVASFVDICLEVLLIFLVRKLMLKYSYNTNNDDCMAGEYV